MIKKIYKKDLIKLFALMMLLILPWYVMGLSSEVVPEKITSDLRFYEINTCEISLIDFLIQNPNVVYQDHYKIRYNNYSSMKCFGTITGIDQINHVFYISIGTSSNLNLVIQTLVWFLIISFIKKNSNFDFSFKLISSLILSSLLFAIMVIVEERFYLKSLYFFDFSSLQHFIQLFLTIFFVSIMSYYILQTRISSLTNYLPFLYLFIGVFSGFNFNFFTLAFTAFGITRWIVNKKIWLNIYYLIFLLLFWANNAYNKEFFVDPDKIRGFSSSLFSSYSVLAYSIFFIFLINGLISIFEIQYNFEIEKYFYNMLYSSLLIFFIGLAGSGIPLFNFLSYYLFGLNKYGITRTNLFEINEWGERIAWRGLYPSAETIGEFFAILIFIYFYLLLNKKINFNLFNLISIIISFICLFASNNRAAFISILLCILMLTYKNFKFYMKYIVLIVFIGISLILIGINNLSYSINFIGDSLLNDAIYYSLGEENYSSSVKYFIDIKQSKSFQYTVISLLSIVSFYINRSELWGIFFARYNPEIQDVLFGSGLLNFGQLYGDVNINSTYSFLLPHSSILSLILFVGIINLTVFLVFILKNLIFKIRFSDNIFIYLSIFALLNLFKSDSMEYFSSFANYLFFFYSAYKIEKK